MQDEVKVIKDEYYNNKRRQVRKKVIVFDLDETIGHFSHLHLICKCLTNYFGRDLFQDEFNVLLELFPEFFRPGILTILDFLHEKKKNGELFKLYIYTNNQCDPPWVNMIINYIHREIGSIFLFDKIICAFKIRNKVVELRRTTNAKTYPDFIQCAMLPEDTVETCFVDNTYHDNMCRSRVYYILPKSYYHPLSKSIMIRRVVNNYGIELLESLSNKLTENTRTTTGNQVAITKKILYYIREFLYYPKIQRTNKTKRANAKRPGTKKLRN